MVHFNIKGGAKSESAAANATNPELCCNGSVAPAIWNSLVNRGSRPNALSFNEVGQSQGDYLK